MRKMDNTLSVPECDKLKIIGIVRNVDYASLVNILPLYIDAGFNDIEITMNTPGAATIIQHICNEYGNKLFIGAGTVCSLKDLDIALHAGAKFIVTPIVIPEVIKVCFNSGTPVYPGALTPTEIHQAWDMGATMVKIFPASSLGHQYIKDVKASLNTIKLLPTGGINLKNIDNFISAGADGFGIGNPLFNSKHIESKDWAQLRKLFDAFAQKRKGFEIV